MRGRGTQENPSNRFDGRSIELDAEYAFEDRRVETQFLPDATKSILSRNDSPDVGFDVSLNPYRGCEHGCAYCYARPTHEYFGLSAGLDFETKIFYKERAPALLRSELASSKWTPQTIALSGVTDPYQPIERKLKITRGCIEVLAECRNPVSIITKNRLVTRDIDLLAELARHHAVAVYISLPTLNLELNRALEPRTTTPAQRLGAIGELREAGIPVGVMVAPVIPALTDHEVPRIVSEAARAGAQFASYTALRLPFAVGPLFEAWLERHLPERKAKILNRLRDMRGGALSESRFYKRMRGEGVFADQIAAMFHVAAQRAGIERGGPELSVSTFRPPQGGQMALF